MFIHRRRGWEIPASEITPEGAALAGNRLGRRALLGGAAGAGIVGVTGSAGAGWFSSAPKAAPVALQPLTAPRNPRYDGGRPMTPEPDATTYNNFYEFGDSKSIYEAAAALKVAPWTIEIAGMVKQPRTIGYDDLMKQMKLEERVYRHRCVETWAMTVPWIGFPLADLVKLAEPLGSATYVKFTTADDPKTMPGVHQSWYPWPYTEGLTVQEAMNELAFLSVGLYGKTLPPQNGAPIRVTVPWKYGFKSAKSIVKVEFTDQRPKTFWEQLQDGEYGFWANVNPEVPHPRWSQAEEKLLGTGQVVPTKIWNGYGELVAGMYADKTKERLFA